MKALGYGYNLNKRTKEDRSFQKRNLRKYIHAEQSQDSKKFGKTLGLLLVFLWVSDWFVDPSNAIKALPFRLACAALLYIVSIRKSYSPSMHTEASITYGALVACELLLLGSSRELHNGILSGIGSNICLFVGTLVLCSSFPFHYNIIGCTLLIVAPIPVVLMLYGHGSFNYILILWQIGLIVILAHQKKRRMMLKKYHIANQEDELNVTATKKTIRIQANPVEDLQKLYTQLTNRDGVAASTHTLLRVRISEKSFETDKAQRCETLSDMSSKTILENISACLRTCDITKELSRFEYLTLLADTQDSIALIVADRIRSRLFNLQLSCPGIVCKTLESHDIFIDIHAVDSQERFTTLLKRFTKT